MDKSKVAHFYGPPCSITITATTTPWAIKNVALYFCPYLCQLLIDFKIFLLVYSADSFQ